MDSPTQLGGGAVLAGRYEIQVELGRGGMGTVYRVYDKQLNEVVALKMLAAAHSEEAASYTHLRAHETKANIVCLLLIE